MTRQQVEPEQPIYWLGGGSNLLITGDLPGSVVRIATTGVRKVDHHGDQIVIEAAAGEPWHPFVLYCLKQGWYGLENLSLIPGTVGASPIQNIGAYGVEISDCFDSLRAWNYQTGEIETMTARDCRFSYRDSAFKQELAGLWVVLSVRFRLSTVPQPKTGYRELDEEIDRMGQASSPSPEVISAAVCAVRSRKLPNPEVLGNAGSFFKNPRVPIAQAQTLSERFPDMPCHANQDGVKLSAAWLIDQAGWKGFRSGDAGVHEQHALVLVNYGTASGAQLLALSKDIEASVAAKFGVQLEREPVCWPASPGF